MPILLQVKVAEGSASTPAKFADSDTPVRCQRMRRHEGDRAVTGRRKEPPSLRAASRASLERASRPHWDIPARAGQPGFDGVRRHYGRMVRLVHGRPAAVLMSSTCSPAAMLGRPTPTRSLTTQHPLMRSRRRCRLNLACAYATGHGSVWAKHAHFRQTAPINGTRDSFAKCARLRTLMRAGNHRSPSLK
jgi:hypothetical protein